MSQSEPIAGKIISKVFTNKKNTIMVFICSTGEQFELSFRHGHEFSSIAGYTNLSSNPVVNLYTSGSLNGTGAVVFNLKDGTSFSVVLGTKEPFPYIDPINGSYALCPESRRIKKLLNLECKEEISEVTGDTSFDLARREWRANV